MTARANLIFLHVQICKIMNTKLTLQLDSFVIDKAKLYAQTQKTSLSKMIESYLRGITSIEKEKEIKISPLVKSIMGVINLPDDFEYKKEYTDYLIDKYK